MRCPRCGHKILDRATFCGNCGYKLTAQDKVNAHRGNYDDSGLNSHISLSGMGQDGNNENKRQGNKSVIKHCPHCGHVLMPGATFCGHCGYQLKNGTNSVPPIQQSISQEPSMPKKQHHFFRHIVYVIVLLAIAGGGGYYGYRNYLVSGHKSTVAKQSSGKSAKKSSNNSSESKSSLNDNDDSKSEPSDTITKSTAQNVLNSIWSDVQDEANNGGDDDIDEMFVDGTDNSDYKDLNGWAKDESKDSSLEHARVKPTVESISSDGTVKYKVDYTFKYSDNTHYQRFIWTAKFKKSGGNWKISSNKASRKPIMNKSE